MIPMALRARGGGRLGQGTRSLRIVVVDDRGHPVPDASVEFHSAREPSGRMIGSTDSGGILDAGLPPDASGPFTIVARKDGYSVSATVPAWPMVGESVFIRVPVCFAGPLMTTPELVALLAGAAMIAAGFHWKEESLKIGGEVLIGASIFTAIFRLSCP